MTYTEADGDGHAVSKRRMPPPSTNRAEMARVRGVAMRIEKQRRGEVTTLSARGTLNARGAEVLRETVD